MDARQGDLVTCIDDSPCQCKTHSCGGVPINGLKKGRVYRVLDVKDFPDKVLRYDVGLPMSPKHSSNYVGSFRFKLFDDGAQIPAIIAMIKHPTKLDIVTA